MILNGGVMKCLVCKQSEVYPGMTTVTLERGEFNLVLKNVPALICPECGEAYTDEETASSILEMATGMEEEGLQVEVRSFMEKMSGAR
jgi:YgiT-type zinc finger domain-containing protein